MKRILLTTLFALALAVASPANEQNSTQQLIESLQKEKAEWNKKLSDAEKKNDTEAYNQAKNEISKRANRIKELQGQLQQNPNLDNGQEPNTKAEAQPNNVEQQQPQDEINAEGNGQNSADTTNSKVTEESPKDVDKTNENNEEKEPISWWKYLLAMIGISALCSGCVFYILNKKIDDFKSMLKADNQSTQRMLNQRLDNLAVKTDRIETSVGSVRQDIRNRDRIVANEPQRPTPSYGPATVQPSQPKRSTEFYLSMPSTDGSWNDVSTVNKPGQCLYVLNSPDGINGTFRVINEPVAVQSILMAVGKYLSPVCRVTNTATQVSGIVTDEPGVAVFENGIWRMTKKAVVHYV